MVTTREASPEELDDAHGAGCDEEASPEELDCIEEIFACFLLAAGGAGDLRTSIEVGRDRVRVVSTGNTVPSGYLTSQPGSGHVTSPSMRQTRTHSRHTPPCWHVGIVTGTAVPLGIAKQAGELNVLVPLGIRMHSVV